MPNNTPIPDAAAVAAHNADIARKMASQDISGKPTATGEFGDAQTALDDLASKIQPKDQAPPDDTTPPPAPDSEAAKAAAEAKAKTESEAAAKKAAEEPHIKRAEEFFKDSPTLPPNASPKSADAFSAIKVKAAQEISRLEQELADLKTKAEQSKNPTPEQLQQQKELEDLKQWRAKIDVEVDPKFKSFDKTIESTRDFIYAQLEQNPAITPEMIAQIKKYGGPDQIKLDKLFDVLKDPTLQRIVEAKVAEIKMAEYEKTRAIKSAKENVTQYLQDREKAITSQTTERSAATEKNLVGMLSQLDWFKDQQAAANADEASKKSVEDHNQWLTRLKGEIKAAMSEDTPEMRAVLITGMAQLFKLQRELPTVKAERDSLLKERDEIKAKWEKVKDSSRSRLEQSGAPPGGIQNQPKPIDVHTRPSDAIDALAKQIMEQKRAAAGQ